MTKDQFISEIAKYVQKYATKYNIKVYSPIIAQAVLESGGGTSELAVNAHNYFGLKYRANRCPTACGIYYKVGSEQNADGSYTSSAMQWMKFSNMENGVIGYFDFTNISTYSNLKGVTDPRTYLENIKKDGYATSLNYVDNVMNVIKSYNLTQYDKKGGTTNMAYKVAIDAGHGSNTAGKRHPDGYREHYSNTYMAYYLEQILSKNGIQTLKTSWDDAVATNDADVALSTRQAQIKSFGADISVSIHANAYGDGKSYNSANGVETLYHSNNSYVGDSKALAQKIQARLIKGTKQSNRGVKTSNLAMCNCKAMGTKASVLVETAFMTNETESNMLKSDAFCRECAMEIAQGIFDYLGVNGNVNVALIPANSNNQTATTSPTASNGCLYRVRKTWADSTSQIGAYYSLDNAKSACKSGYYVFDENGNVVYPTNQSDTSTHSASSAYTKTQFIKDVQTAIGAKVDGVAGTETLSKTVTVSKTKNIKHAVVKPIQKYLNILGYNCGTEDGIAGAKFDAAVKAYQKANGCTADGEITAQNKTWKKLLGLI